MERPLDDEAWRHFARFQERRPGGFAIAALMRPPAEGEDESLWLERTREALARGPFGLHTHWSAPDHARPSGGDPAALVREQDRRLRVVGLEPGLFCGGGWYMDEAVADTLAELGYADCTATAFRPAYLAPDAAHLQVAEPAWVELASGRRLLELPTTHSIGMLARGLLGPFRRQVVHAYFHDTDLLDRSRSTALRVGLGFLGVKRTASDLEELQRHGSARPQARRRPARGTRTPRAAADTDRPR